MRKPFAPEEEEAAALLQRAGLPRPAARCLACLLRGGAWETPDVMAASGLGQPEVSAGMRDLVARGLAEVERVAREGKGRRPLRHRLAEEPAAAMARLLGARRAQLRAELADLDEIERRLG